MKKLLLMSTLGLALSITPAMAAQKTYQVTGPVLGLTADAITVQKGKEKWEIAKGTATLPAELKVGDKVTIQYSMTAVKVSSEPLIMAKDVKAK